MNTIKKSLQCVMLISMATIINVFTGCNGPVQKESAISVKQTDSIIEIDNGLVKGRFHLTAPAVTQSFYVLKDKRWELIVESLVRPEQTGLNVMPLYGRGADFADDFRLMVQEGLKSVKILENSKEKARILFSGGIGTNKIEQVVSLERNRDYFHIEVTAMLPGDQPKVEYVLSSYVFTPGSNPDYMFTPTVKRADDDLIGDRKFFAPATILEKNGLMAALVPDLEMINDNVIHAAGARPQKHPRIFAIPIDTSNISFPTGMDLSLNSGITDNPVLSYGFIDYWTEQHVYWRHENKDGAQIRTLSDNRLKYGFDLFLNANVEKYRGYQRISSYLWERYGAKYFHLPRPQVMPFAEYAKICYPASFAYQGYDVTKGPVVTNRSGKPELASWQQWDMNGVPVGGFRLSAPQWYQFIYNTAWWNNVCDATGMYYWGKKSGDSSLLDKARRIIRFTLSAPQKDGLFPGLYNINDGTWQPSLWNPPLEGYDPNKIDSYWGWDNNRGVYQTASASVTAGFLMYYRQFCENDPDILPYVQRYGDFLIRNLEPNGCVPGWFTKLLEPLPSLRWNADGGAHIWVLSELYRATKEKKYADAAEKIAACMIDEVMPHQKWYDFETFYSCAVKPETFYDYRTGQYPANNMSTSWALEGFSSLYEITQKKEYLAAAEAAADYSLFYQAVWAPHYIVTAYPFGGFSSQNSDAEWLDQRSHRFADGLLRIGLLAGRQDLLERAVAAARSSLTLVNLPGHIENDVYKYPNFPLGLGPENIDHEGFPQMPLRSGPSWCEIGGLAAAAHLMHKLGGIYINFERNIALGIDGISVDRYSVKNGEINISMKSLLAELPVPFNEPFTLEMRMEGLPEQNYELIINGGDPIKATVKDLAHVQVIVQPAGLIKIGI
ncbi:MAG: hypothetical protein D4R64_16000 [Porphyromonadaceae bacterium]|nr:MAG: hypothetical protein D4R64_16000 [Porphyromonadaceae bacterium]